MSTEITDYAPVGIVDDRDILFNTLRGGELAATLSAVDTGPLTGGRWIIDGQSHSGLFSIAYNPATDTAARLLVANAASLPQVGTGVSVTVHYYDRYQLDGNGNPLPGKGVVETLVYTVEAGASRELAAFGADLLLGSAAPGASPALASLSTGGFAAVWQAPGGKLTAQMRDAAGTSSGTPFTLAASGAAPSVAALDDGGFVAAYTLGAGSEARVAWRIVRADGSVMPEAVAGGADTDIAMPDVAVLADGSIAIAWRAGGQVHVRHVDGAGNPLGAEEVFGTFGSAFSPSITALGSSYVVAWGEIGDGNVHAALPGGASVQVTGDGLAASLSTAAPLPDIVALSDGSFVVAWDSYANSPYGFTISDIFFQRFDAAGKPLGGITQANIDSGGGRFGAKLAALDEGGFMLAWQAQGGDFDGNGIFGRRFDADGTALDAREFGINEGRAGDQAGPALAALAHGGFAAAWIDTQDGGAAQIEARVLAGTAPALPEAGSSGSSGSSEGSIAAPPPAAAPPVITAPAVPVPAPAKPVAPPLPRVDVSGGTGADLIHMGAGAGNQRIDALDGLDTVRYAGAKAGFTLQHGAAGLTVRDAAGASDVLLNVERIVFADAALAFDIDGVAGQAYRLYTAAFDRAPDKEGVGYWIRTMDAGATLEQVAAGFAGSAEFKDLYGANASDAQFVGLLYNNVLHRSAEGAGYDYWMKALAELHTPREQVLAFFSESTENQAQVIGAIQNGIEFTPWN